MEAVQTSFEPLAVPSYDIRVLCDEGFDPGLDEKVRLRVAAMVMLASKGKWSKEKALEHFRVWSIKFFASQETDRIVRHEPHFVDTHAGRTFVGYEAPESPDYFPQDPNPAA